MSAETISNKKEYVKKFHIKFKTWYFFMMLCIICVGESFGEQDPDWQTLWLQSIKKNAVEDAVGTWHKNAAKRRI